MKKPDLFMVGRTKIEVDADKWEEIDNLLIVQCDDASQVRDALKAGKIEFLVFGEEITAEKIESGKKKLGISKPTERGFPSVSFADAYKTRCHLQCSSGIADDYGYENPGTSFVWLGVNSAKPQILASKAKEHGIRTVRDSGWVRYPVHEDVLMTTAMHLDREQVAGLIDRLQEWLDTGRFEEDADTTEAS